MIKYIPNFLSLLRILIAFIFPFLEKDSGLVFLFLALLTEFFDGYFARKYQWLTKSGVWLDPLADKLLAVSVGLSFVYDGRIHLTELMIIYSRDLTASAGFLFYLVKNKELLKQFKPALFGKITTLFQYIVFFDLLLKNNPDTWLVSVTGIMSFIASVQYMFNFFFSSDRTRPFNSG